MKLDDIAVLLREQEPDEAKRVELLRVAALTAEELESGPSSRPEFRAQLRERLLARARHQFPREPALLRRAQPGHGHRRAVRREQVPKRRSWWGWGLAAGAVAAAGLAFSVLLSPTGIQLPLGLDQVGSDGSPASGFITPEGILLPQPQLVAADAGLHPSPPGVELGRLQITPRLTPTADLPERVTVYRLTPRGWSQPLLASIAQRLGLQDQAVSGASGTTTGAERCAVLAVSPDGTLEYRQTCVTPTERRLTPAEAAEVARRFLVEHGLPQPGGGEPRVYGMGPSGVASLLVELESALEGRRVMGTPDRIVVAPSGEVLYARLQPVAAEPWTRVPLKAAREAARELAGEPVAGREQRVTLTGVELVYGRPPESPAGQPLSAQPFYRFSGRSDDGANFVGYVPAALGSRGQR